ncbi:MULTISPECIES: phosphate signaling complex protein PhoU [Haloprofundus]|uniref:phosphate signaling complex protein PhoU n=1 Tax=Haloprofundus TaxID=1911573 RepID=UPI000E438AB9|nr:MULTISPECIES: phosphate signaling complex protein PhoU [Haloprofundus]QCJ46204.1 phosphate signaling complex protein PhoU [Haloprofundus sp. MHR1]
MPREQFQRELDDLRDEVLTMGEAVVSRLRKALSALEARDSERARSLAERDHEINEWYLRLESRCVDLLALQQPVAGDLRLVVASFKIITDLERIADLVTNICGYHLSRERELFPEVNLQDLGDIAAEMVEDALAAYAGADADACYAVADRDDELDGLCERVGELVVRDLVESAPDDRSGSLFGEVNRFLLTVRDIERVGDHAVNIAARTLYMVESDDALIY